MAATTSNRAYPYPQLTDDVDPPGDLQALATAIDTDVNGIVRPPMGRILAPSIQNMANNTNVAINFGTGSETGDGSAFDTDSFHDDSSNNTRVTPTRAGIYAVYGVVYFNPRSDYTAVNAYIRKNGAAGLLMAGGSRIATGNAVLGLSARSLVQVNGSGDYFELVGFQTNTAAATPTTQVSVQFTSVLEWEYRRPLP